MKISGTFLLFVSGLLVAAAIFITSCAKDNALPPADLSNAAERGTCQVKIITTGPVDICGTQTNAIPCGTSQLGVESVGAGTYNYTISSPATISITNTSLGSMGVQASAASNLNLIIPAGETRSFAVQNDCSLTRP